ncbi:MAG: GrpB family protein [Candidatus Nanoarchaeia archaeon]
MKKIVYEKYKFRKYENRYKRQFLSEKAKLKRIFPSAPIEHIGSTAVPGLGGKGIIDINLGTTKKEVKRAIIKLNSKGYLFSKTGGDGKERWLFKKDYKYRGEIRRVHVHLIIVNSESWKKCIFFREYMLKNKSALKKYAELKKRAVSLGMKGDEYRDYKRKFIESIVKKSER